MTSQCSMLACMVYYYSETWLQSHCLQHQTLYNNAHGRNGFNGLCTKCPGYSNNLVITAHFSGTKGVVVNKFECIILARYTTTLLLLLLQLLDWLDIIVPQFQLSSEGEEASTPTSPASIPKEFQWYCKFL